MVFPTNTARRKTMNPIEVISNEHGLIRQFCDNLDMACDKIALGNRPSCAFFEKAIEVARKFNDGYHHFKEEHVLFVQLAQKKHGEIDAQLDALRNQHERSRELVTAMESSLPGYEAQDENQTGRLVDAARGYSELLRKHIHREDHVFLPLAQGMLSAAELDGIKAEFDRQREKQGGDAFERYHKEIVDLGSILSHLR
jgi:hemerythrin-like domain-containing protein